MRLLSIALSRKNSCDLNIIEHGDIIDFKNYEGFPEYKGVLTEKTEEIMIEQQKEKQKALNESLNLGNSKVDKIFWSEIVVVTLNPRSQRKCFLSTATRKTSKVRTFHCQKEICV